MPHLKLLTVALVAVLAFGAIIASAAQAEPKLKGTPSTVTASGGAGSLKAGSEEIKCEKNTASGEITSSTLGLITIKWTECKTSAGAKCKTTGAATEEIVLSNDSFHVVLVGSGAKMYWIEFLEPALAIKCGVVNVTVKGNVLLSTTLEEGVGTTTTTLVGSESGGKQAQTSCSEPAELCTENPIELLSEFVEGKPESSVLIQTDTITSTNTITAEG